MPSPSEDDIPLREVPRRAAKMFGELASTYETRGMRVVGRLRDVGELRKREPYRDVVIFGRGPTWRAAFAQAEKHFHDGTPDEILDAIEGRAPRLVGGRG